MADHLGPFEEFLHWIKEGQRIVREIGEQYGRKPKRSADRKGQPGAPSRKARRDAQAVEATQAAAAPGPGVPGTTANVIIHWIANEGWVVHFETGLGVPLGGKRVLYGLLKLLCAPKSVSNHPSEGLVPFKTVAELIASTSAGGPSISAHCLSGQISRLWKILREHNHGDLMEKGPQGYRIRLREGGQLIDRSSGDWDDED